MFQSEERVDPLARAAFMQGEALPADQAYWQEQLAEVSPHLYLPTGVPHSSTQQFQGGIHPFFLPSALSERMKIVSQQEGVTLFTGILAVFYLLLARYSGQEHILVGASVAELARAEGEEDLAGTSEMLPLPASIALATPFTTFLARIGEMVHQAYAHRAVAFAPVLEKLRREHSPESHALFQIIFRWQEHVEAFSEPPDAFVSSPLAADPAGSPDLLLRLQENARGVQGAFEYNAGLFHPRIIAEMADHFLTLLAEIAARPQQRLATVPLLTVEERRRIVETWNATDQEWPRESTVVTLFQHQLERTPDALAVVSDDLCLTYQELNRRANQLAYDLIQQGVGLEIPVGVYLERSIDLVVALLGVLKTGGAYVPLDPSAPPERVKYIVKDAGIQVLITSRELRANLCADLRLVITLDKDSLPSRAHNLANPPQVASPENLCYIIYTSGSTGQPKGVSIQHQGLTNLIIWHHRTYGPTSASRATQISGLAFDATVWEIWPYLTAGASVHLPDAETHASPEQLIKWINTSGCTHSVMTTPIAQFVLAQQLLVYTSLRYLLTGGEKLHSPARRAHTFQFVNHYGPTENTVVATSATIDLTEESKSDPPIGRPIMNVQTYILDPRLEPVPAGVVGELYIGGPGLARGYLNRPDLTAASFLPNPFDPLGGSRLYRTGDLTRYMLSGDIEYVGRIDRQVKVRGFRIELGEIEAALNQHPGIEQVAVILATDPSGERQIRAYVVPHAGAMLTIEDLRHYLAPWLPAYMLPSACYFLPTLPLTANGKVDQTALLALEQDQFVPEREIVVPETEAEKVLLRIWQTALKREDIGIHDSFFDVGGYSFLLVQVYREIKKHFRKEISILDLLTHATIATCAAYLTEGEEASHSLAQEDLHMSRHIQKRQQQRERQSSVKARKEATSSDNL